MVYEYHRENPSEPKAWEARVGRGGQRNREGPETAEDERLQKARDEMLCTTAAVPVKRGFGTGFVPLGFRCTARLSELADSREGTEERNLTMFCLA
jgi:hypothetical protein